MSNFSVAKTLQAFMEIHLMMVADQILLSSLLVFDQVQKWSKVKKAAYINL